jgi:hypothetical protein
MKRFTTLLCMALLCASSLPAFAMDTAERLNMLEKALNEQAKIIEEQQRTINEVKEQMKTEQATTEQVKTAQPEDISQLASTVTGLFGGALMTNPYLSVVLDAKGYGSNLKNNALRNRGIHGFTSEGQELKNGFNTDGAEFFVFAPVDPYFDVYVNVPINEDGAAFEEGYFVTTSLPEGLQVKGGRFKSNTSRLNAQHPHAWDFVDIALPYKAFLGGEGIGGENGVQLTWLPPLPVYTLLGVEVLQGDNPLLFGDDDNWGPHAFTGFAKVSIDTSENSTLFAGPWAMFGKTNTTSDSILLPDAMTASGNSFGLRGNSSLYGMEAVWKWKSGKHGVTLQGEYLYLTQNGDLTEIDADGAVVSVNSLKRHQDGAYLQALYRYDRWRVGARYEILDLFTDDFKWAGVEQDLGSKPWRSSGIVEFNPTEFSTIRAQFSADHTVPNQRVNYEGILQVLFTIGAHPAHTF